VKIVYALPFEPVVRSRSILGLGLPSSANGNLKSVYNYGIKAGNIFTMCNATNDGVNKMFITLTTVSYTLLLIQTKLGDMRDKFTSLKL